MNGLRALSLERAAPWRGWSLRAGRQEWAEWGGRSVRKRALINSSLSPEGTMYLNYLMGLFLG